MLNIGSWFGGRKNGSEEAHTLVEQGALLLDVRTREEFGGGHIEGAVNIPVQELPRRAKELPQKGRPIVVYCRSGARSAAAAGELRKLGYDVHDLGPMSAW
jgi:rhodanese-related sulfurtransferase